MPTRTSCRTAILGAWIFTLLLFSNPAAAQLSQSMQDMLRRINSPEFSGGGGRGGAGAGNRWVDGGQGYTRNERGANGEDDCECVSDDVLAIRVGGTRKSACPSREARPLFEDVQHNSQGKQHERVQERHVPDER